MKVLIVAKTRRGGGACVGGISQDGHSVRLVAPDAARNDHAGLEYEVGEVWDIESAPDPDIIPPHVENILVLGARRLRHSSKLKETICRFLPPVTGGPEKLFDGLAQATSAGALYISQHGGVPRRSTMFWEPDQPLRLDFEGKRIRYRYPTPDGGRTLTFVGFQEPLSEIPRGTLLRVSLAHWWRPEERPEDELRCFVQLSGWYLEMEAGVFSPPARKAGSLAARLEGNPQPDPQSALLLRAAKALKRTFGFSDFLPVQADVVTRVLQGQDALVVMPTGGGKSLCYQLPALLLEGLTVVVSPLVALMQDQINQLAQVGVSAACLNHLVPLQEYRTTMAGVRAGRVKLLYLAPETLLRPETLLLVEQSRLACLAIDEAHCISEWGHDFRPEYRQLSTVRRRFSDAVCLALTATATHRVRQDIRALLDIPRQGEFVASFNRQNLFLEVQPRRDGLAQVVHFLENHGGQSGIVYCGTRKQADDLSAALTANGWPALPYHAGMAGDERRRNQERFIHDEVPLMVATVAFGMGINKSNVRFVIHAHLPKDIESYYQEIGRAGRDGLPAHCLLLYSRADAVLHRRRIEEGAASEQQGREARLLALMRYAEARGCRRQPLLAYFDENHGDPCGNCDNCLRTRVGGRMTERTADARKFLSCVQLTGQMFGAAHLAAVLRGSRSERVRTRRHDRLSVFGTGRAHSAAEWQELADDLLQAGLLERDLEFGILRLTSQGHDVLRGKEQVLVPAQESVASVSPKAAPRAQDPELFAKLRELRKTLAKQAGLPAYFIFSDRALLEMATSLPQDNSQFLAINGVGQVKMATYGEPFIAVIREHCMRERSGLHSEDAVPTRAPVVCPSTGRRSREIGELFAGGLSLDQIAARCGILPETVAHHLHQFHHSGGSVDAGRLLAASRLSEAERARVLSLFTSLGTERLAPVHAALAGAVCYKELHLLRLYWLSLEQTRVDSERC